jgi:hypothetical protein
MAKNNNLQDFLTDVADGIRAKKGTTEKINPQDFRQEIESIETGVDATDATATASDMLLGKTAYGSSGKIEGTIETYNLEMSEGGVSEDYLEALCNDTLINYSSSNITKVKDYLFQNTKTLISVDLPNATSIGSSAFNNCSKLTSVNAPKVTNINGYAFGYCSELIEINFPNVTSIGNNAFQKCKKITNETMNFAVAVLAEVRERSNQEGVVCLLDVENAINKYLNE